MIRYSAGHYPISLSDYAMQNDSIFPRQRWTMSYSLPHFVTAKFGSKSFYCSEILIVCFFLLVLDTHQFFFNWITLSDATSFFYVEYIMMSRFK